MRIMYYERFNQLGCDSNCKARKILALLSFFIISFFFFSCDSSADKTLKASSEIVFDFYYPSGRVQYFESDSSEYVLFDDLRTNDRAFVCDLDGNRIYTLPIDSLIMKEKVRFQNILASHLDTLVLLSFYTNKVLLINSIGEIIREKDYSPLLLQGAEMHFPIYYRNNMFRSALQYYIDTVKLTTIEDYWDNNERGQFFYNMLYDKSFFEDDKHVLQLDSLYCRFVNKKEFATGVKKILMLDSLNVFYSSYNDSIYVYGLHDNLIRVVPVKSEYNDIVVKPVTFEQFFEDMNVHNDNIRNNSLMYYLSWDKYRNVYYCFIRGAMEGRKMPFSIIILDEDFNVLDEVKMNHDKYIPSGFVGKEGLYIRNVIGDNLKETKFTLFKYE